LETELEEIIEQARLDRTTKLELSRRNIKIFPETIGNLSNLTSLGLSGNNLTTLPETIGNLSNLTSLGLSGNNLTTLPESIGNLSKLTSLWLSDWKAEWLLDRDNDEMRCVLIEQLGYDL
jgi:Leucine-rich repeat (LRR) protein